MELASITHEEGQNNTPGVARLAAFKFTDVLIFPDVVSPSPELATNLADCAKVTSDLIMKQNKVLVDVYHTDTTGEFSFKLQGAPDSKSFKVSLKCSIPLRATNLAGFLAYVKNMRCGLVVQLKGGEKILMGGPTFPVKAEVADGTSGGNATSSAGAEVTFSVDDPCAVRWFTGKVMTGSGSWGGSGAGATEQTLFAN